MAAVATTYTDINARSHGRRMDPPHVILFVVMCLFALAMLFPFIWMVLTSLKPETEVVAFPPKLIPHVWSIDSYVNVWQRIPFGRFFANSIVFAGGVTLISLTLDSMTAFALSRLGLPGRDAIFIVVLIALVLPFQVTFIPLYVTVYQFGWLNSFAGLIVPRATNAFG